MYTLILLYVFGPIFLISIVNTKFGSAAQTNDIEETIIDPHVYREPGCPIVAERFGFNKTKLEGSDWKLTYGSMNWLADIAFASLGRHPKVSEIRMMCPIVTIKSLDPSTTSNTTFEIIWTCPRLNTEPMSLRCWPQRSHTESKFECFFSKANIHTYIMVAATDHESWVLLTRCKIGVTMNQPGEGMSWAVLSKSPKLHPDTAMVVLGVLEGYGFDLNSFTFEHSYEKC